MKIKLVNVRDDYFIKCVGFQTDSKGKDVIFIDWVPVVPESVNSKSLKQIETITGINEDVPVIVFDRYCSITDTELLWFTERNVVLMEPAVNHRNGFIFHPYWLDIVDPPLSLFEPERKYKIGTPHYLLFQDILRELSINEPSIPIAPYNTDINDIFSVLIGGDTEKKIQSGIIPDITKFMKSGTVPLLYKNHKWMYSIFDGLIVRDLTDLKWYSNMSPFLQYGFIKSIYDNIENYLPEMKTENFVSNIISIFNKM